MASEVGFWRFMDDVQEMTLPMASIDWREIPVIVKVEPSPTKKIPVVNSQPATEHFYRRYAVHDIASGGFQVEQVAANEKPEEEKECDITNQQSNDISGDKGQEDVFQQAKKPILEEDNLVQEGNPANLNTGPSFEDLSNQIRELLQEKGIALRWQDVASMAIKEAKDEVDICKQKTKAAKKVGLQAAATVQRQLDDSKKEIEVLKGNKARTAAKKIRADSEHRKKMSVAERKIGDLQAGLDSATTNGRESTARLEELSETNKELQNKLLAKDQKLVEKDSENKVLQDRIDARDSTIQDVEIEAEKDRKACNRYCREKFESEKAQRGAERKVDDLERKTVRITAKTDKAMKALKTKLDESEVRGKRANARATEAEGDIEQLKRELDNTESARQTLEKKEGEWAALFAENRRGSTKQSKGTSIATNVPVFETRQRIPSTETNEAEVSELGREITEHEGKRPENPEQQAAGQDPEAQEKIKELEGEVKELRRAWKVAENGEKTWKNKIRREFNEKYRTVVASERSNIRNELEAETQKVLAAERKIIRQKAKRSLGARLAVKFKPQKYKGFQRIRRRTVEEGKRAQSKKSQVEWGFKKAEPSSIDADRSQLETQIRNHLQTEFQRDLSNHKTQWEVERMATERSQLEIQIREQLQTEFQRDLSNHKTQWEIDRMAMERSQIETQIREQLQTEYQNEISKFKTQWETENSPSQAGLESQKNAAAGDWIEVDKSEDSGSATTRSVQDDMLLASLSRESDETHKLFQEIGEIGLPHDSGACVVLRELNQAKDVLYDVKCELRNLDAVVNKNNLLQLVGSIHVNDYSIRQLDPATSEVLIRQANEANRRLEYVQMILGKNEDISRDAMLEVLLGPLRPEFMPEHEQISAPAQTTQASGLSQNPNVLENETAPGASALTPFGNPSFPCTPAFPLVNGFGNPAAPGTSAFPLAFKGFGDPAVPKTSETKGVFNPFENSHFTNQPAMD